jgi:hypothetical protein
MKYFHYHDLIPYFDMALMDSETIVTNPKYSHIGYTLESKPSDVSKKLYESTVVFIHPDSFEKWKNILILLNKRKPLPIKLIVFSGSDYYFDDDTLEEISDNLKDTKFWIQNYTGTKQERFTILPIGVKEDYDGVIEKNYLFGISYFSNNGGFREELIEFLNSDESMKQYCTPKVSQEEFYPQLSQFYFNVCPMGNGFDTHRFWECLMVGTIPIIKSHDYFDNLLYQYPNLPVVVVKSWQQLPMLIDTLTQDKYNELINKGNIDIIYTNYWVNKIIHVLIDI